MMYDPLVVDSTAELDRSLESGHAPPPNLDIELARPAFSLVNQCRTTKVATRSARKLSR
jgi:hypothetical protein